MKTLKCLPRLSAAALGICLLSACERGSGSQISPPPTPEAKTVTTASLRPTEEPAQPGLIHGDGRTLEERFSPPAGYRRSAADSLQAYTRAMELKEDGSPVLLYDGTEKGNQRAHAAVFSMPVFSGDLQQCADSVIRLYAEYFRAAGTEERIAFHLTNGFLMDYSTWSDGNRLSVNGNDVSWVKKAAADSSDETFLSYLQHVMMYAGTLSLDLESSPIEESEIQAGDLFIKGGTPGHCVVVVDTAESESGDRCFLLAQGYMPAQDFHVLKNPLHEEDPWYYLSEISYPLATPEYIFEEGSLQRWSGFR